MSRSSSGAVRALTVATLLLGLAPSTPAQTTLAPLDAPPSGTAPPADILRPGHLGREIGEIQTIIHFYSDLIGLGLVGARDAPRPFIVSRRLAEFAELGEDDDAYKSVSRVALMPIPGTAACARWSRDDDRGHRDQGNPLTHLQSAAERPGRQLPEAGRQRSDCEIKGNRLMKLTSILVACACALACSVPGYAQVPPVAAPDQAALLKSSDAKLAANKKLVFDMYRAIIQAGRTDLAPQFFTESYIQHNPNVATGRDALVAYIKKTRPVRPIDPTITFPVISIIAEGEMVMVAVVTFEPDAENPGKKYATTHFDLYRIENGKIAEHWDHVPRSKAAQSFNPNVDAKE